MRACSLGLVGLGLRIRLGLVLRDRVGVRVIDGVRVSTFYFCHISSPQKPAGPILPTSVAVCLRSGFSETV